MEPNEQQLIKDHGGLKKGDVDLASKISSILESKEVGLETNDWGSCQYSNALNIFKALNIVGPEQLGIKYSYKGIRSSKEACELFWEEICEDEDLIKQLKKEGFRDIEHCFRFARDHCWDLWSAAPFIAECLFEELDYSSVGKAEGKGPILNIMVQSENYATGFCCWLIYNKGFVKDLEVFEDFDT